MVKKDKNLIWWIILIVVVVAIAVSLLTMQLTGNAILKKPSTITSSKNDQSASAQVTYQGVLNMLSQKCMGVKWEGDITGMAGVNYTCDTICGQRAPGKTCVSGVGVHNTWENDSMTNSNIYYFGCSTITSPVNIDLTCMCCSP